MARNGDRLSGASPSPDSTEVVPETEPFPSREELPKRRRARSEPAPAPTRQGLACVANSTFVLYGGAVTERGELLCSDGTHGRSNFLAPLRHRCLPRRIARMG